MMRELKVISNSGPEEVHTYKILPPEEKLRHVRNVTGSVLQDALDAWGDIWNELQGSVTHGLLISPEVKAGFTPGCGWPEFLEKMWLLNHYLDYAKRLCEGKEAGSNEIRESE